MMMITTQEWTLSLSLLTCIPVGIAQLPPVSGQSCGTTLGSLRTACHLAWAYLSLAFLTRPLQLVAPLGGLCFLGSATFWALFFRTFLPACSAYGTCSLAWAAAAPHFMAALELFLMGCQLVATGVVAEMCVRTVEGARGEPKYDVAEVVNT